jgi:hypothetical protein
MICFSVTKNKEDNTMEMENKYGGRATAGLTTGIIGTALGAMSTGIIPGLFGGGNCANSENVPVNRYEMNLQRDLTNKDMEIAYLKGRDAAKSDSLELYKYVDGKFAHIEGELANQRVFNATQIGTISCIQGQVAQLMGLTKVIVPAANICPEPMPQYNSWAAPTTTTTAGA